ncbi:MAG TPA: NAD(P)-dependent oxidoreductase [Thermoanaerobaculia bacterium]|nr:NAD(P)-dependent oxidoreductase [Thermoanaerobaculia bacterium]
MTIPRIAPRETTVGWIGTGLMGRFMAGHLIDAGYRLTVHTRTRAKADPLLERGAAWADSPQALADACDVVVTMVGLPSEVEATFAGPEGALARARAGQLFIDMSTDRPTLSRRLAEMAAARGAYALDAPVSGGQAGAKAATLSIMVGGDEAAVLAADPLLRAMGKTIVHHGGPGAGQNAKLVNQTLIAGAMVGVCEGLLYAQAAGLDLHRVLASVEKGAAGSWSLTHSAPRILAGDFEPGFMVEHFLKDMAITLDEARRMGLSLPGLALVEQLYVAAQAQGLGHRGVQALWLALAHISKR